MGDMLVFLLIITLNLILKKFTVMLLSFQFSIQNCQASLAMQHVYIVHQRVVNPMEQLLPTIVYEANTNWVILIHIL